MKHILLGTSALVAAGLLAAPASAAEPIELQLGGFYNAAMGFVVDEDDGAGESGENHNSFDIHQNIEVHFNGETTLDNGITVTARIELEGEQSGDQIDETWAEFSGGFGAFRFGATNEASVQTCVGEAGSVTANFGVNSPNEAFNNAGDNGIAGVNSFGTCYGVENDSLKLIYFTPQFGPFNFAVSYSPDAGSQSAQDKGPSAGTSTETDANSSEDVVSVGGNFSHEGNGFSLLGSLGGSWVLDDTADGDETEFYQAGLQVGFGAFTIGVGGQILNNYNDAFEIATTGGGDPIADDSDLWVAQVGGNYAFDAWTLGLGWTHTQAEVASGGDEDVIDYISLNGAYAIGPGIDLEGHVGYVNYDDDATTVSNADYDAFEVGFGTHIGF